MGFVRVVRFTGVDAESVAATSKRIEESGGPPPGVTATGIEVLFDADHGTAVVLQHFATAEDMEESAKVLDAMPAGDTPGTRASVDVCESTVTMTM